MTLLTIEKLQCNTCKKRKQLTEFPIDKRRPLGVRSTCKECRNDLRAGRRQQNRQAPRVKPRPQAITNDAPSKPLARPLTADELLTQSKRRALMQLVKRHRSEFDLLVAQELKAASK